MSVLNIFLIWVLPVGLLVFGMIGNTVGFFVFSRRSLSKFPGRDIYRTLAIMDTLYLIHVILQYFLYYNGMGIRLISGITCKIVRYLNYSLAPISAWLIVYLSIHKFISIRFREQKKVWQKITITFIITYNMAYYLPIMWLVTLITKRRFIGGKMRMPKMENNNLDEFSSNFPA